MRPARLSTLAPAVIVSIRQARRELRAGTARLRVFRGGRAAALRVLAARDSLGDGEVVIATFTGPIHFNQALTRPDDTRRVGGQFAYVMLDPRRGTRLELGVLHRVPADLRAALEQRE